MLIHPSASAEPQPHPQDFLRKTVAIAGLETLCAHYDTFLIDQWGVLHDGQRPYPGVLDCLDQLRRADKQVIVLSNSGKGVHQNQERLAALGILPNHYSAMLTSGSLAAEMLHSGLGPFGDLRGCNALLIGDDARTLEDLPLHSVQDVTEADLIYLAAMDDRQDQGFYNHLIQAGCRLDIPLICANPDLVRITPQGLKPSAGRLAQRYAKAGGRVWMIGKPYPEIYTACKRLAHAEKRTRLLAIGDSLDHDIRGGNAAGMDTLLVTGGVHADAFNTPPIPKYPECVLSALTNDVACLPHWIMPTLQWNASK
jgi:HAD superfamily hydrolase (TIGR01459 family)